MSTHTPTAAIPRVRTTAIDTCFEGLALAGRTALIPYLMAGDPDLATTAELMRALARGGADIIELGIPFSDPMADGPVIQQAAERALAQNVGLGDVLQLVRAFKRDVEDVPVVLMGYANPIECYGVEAFVQDAADAGVDGVLVVDYPPEECAEFARQLKAVGIDLIFLLAPTSTESRMALVGELASGYVYYVSLRGVTGAGHLDTQAVAEVLPRIRHHVAVPVGVGFGIRDGATARAVAQSADAVVIGSALVQAIFQAPSAAARVPAAQAFISDIRSALDQKSGDKK